MTHAWQMLHQLRYHGGFAYGEMDDKIDPVKVTRFVSTDVLHQLVLLIFCRCAYLS